jgi:hypothetical protein
VQGQLQSSLTFLDVMTNFRDIALARLATSPPALARAQLLRIRLA